MNEFCGRGRTKDSVGDLCKACLEDKTKNQGKTAEEQAESHKARCEESLVAPPSIPRIPNDVKDWATKTSEDHNVRHLFKEILATANRTKYCPICRCELKFSEGRFSNNSATLDQVDNRESGEKSRPEDFWIICRHCNCSKCDRTMAEFIEYCKMVADKFGGVDPQN